MEVIFLTLSILISSLVIVNMFSMFLMLDWIPDAFKTVLNTRLKREDVIVSPENVIIQIYVRPENTVADLHDLNTYNNLKQYRRTLFDIMRLYKTKKLDGESVRIKFPIKFDATKFYIVATIPLRYNDIIKEIRQDTDHIIKHKKLKCGRYADIIKCEKAVLHAADHMVLVNISYILI